MTALAGQCRGSGVWREVEFALRDARRDDRHGKVRPDNARHYIHFFGLDHFVGELHRDVGLALVVFDNDLDVVAARLPDGKHEAVTDIDAQTGTAPGQCGDHADLDAAVVIRRRAARQCR